MTENNNNSLLNKEIDSLPESIKVYLFSERFDQDIQKISDELSLNNTQKEALEDEVVFILMGLESIDNTVINLRQAFTEEEKLLDVFDRILSLIDPFLKSIVEINIRHSKEAEEGNLKKNVPVPPPKPAPAVEKDNLNEQKNTQNENSSNKKNDKPNNLENGKINSLKNLQDLEQSEENSKNLKGLTYNDN